MKTDGKKTFFKRRKSCPFSGPKAPVIDWKNTKMLGRYISERGKIVPSRITAVSQKKQLDLAGSFKRGGYMGLLDYLNNEAESPRNEY